MPLTQDPEAKTEKSGELTRFCRNCGHIEKEKKGLVMETVIQGQSSESYKVFLNEFTKEDPRLPHVKNLLCPNGQCKSRNGQAESDVIYIKYDTVNLKYLYICNVCGEQWRSRS
jgi:DNA-directed RNA polymerase subunit M/transcription elongation factor TFIIS